ncbi:MAG: glycosyltransferase family 39 protein [Planctomycetota bacterium]|nr:glycosyltransferase family 39 protein [Planctomycetota bacterium]
MNHRTEEASETSATPSSSQTGLLPSPSKAFTGAHWLMLLGIVCIAAALRLYKLGEWSLWVDEAHTWRDVTIPLGEFFNSARRWYPLSYLGLRGLLEWGWLPGESEYWLRAPFALFGILTVPWLAMVGKQLVGRRAALLAALFLAINPWHIYWSQNARAYVLVVFFVVVSVGLFLRGIRNRSYLSMGASFLVMLAAGACHFTALSLLPVYVAYGLLSRGMTARRAWIIGIATVVFVPLLPHLLSLLPPFQHFQRAKPQASLWHLVQTIAFYFRLPLICASGLGIWLLLRKRLEGRALFLTCWSLIPIFVLSVVGFSLVKVTARYALTALPAMILLSGYASVRMADVLAAGLGSSSRASRLLPATILPLILCLDMISYDYLYFRAQYGDRGRYREASTYIEQEAGPNPAAVLTVNQRSMLYYLRPGHWRLFEDPHHRWVFDINQWKVYPRPGTASEYLHNGRDFLLDYKNECRRSNRKLFVVVTLPELKEKDRDGSLRRALRDEFEIVRVLECNVGPKQETIYIYRPRW